MADHLNPFLDSADDMIENEIPVDPGPPIAESTSEVLGDTEEITLDHIAMKLLKDSLILTALELHTELVESGRELPRLRDFFSNPANFERTKTTETSPTGLPRTSSCQTFDSLDFARYSDDGDRQDDKVAVLEFELRKAQDTIKSLRASLTKTAETELSTPESQRDHIEDFGSEEPIRPYEKRALNFLVNEYMLNNDYKLTSVTFAEENENQDFEDWDDVGLNVPKPPDILRLFRDYGQHAIPVVDTKDAECSADLELDTVAAQILDGDIVRNELSEKITQLEEQIQTLTTENDFLAHQLKEMERRSDANRLIKSSTPAVSPIGTPARHHEVHSQDVSENRTTESCPPDEGVKDAVANDNQDFQMEGVQPLSSTGETNSAQEVDMTDSKPHEDGAVDDASQDLNHRPEESVAPGEQTENDTEYYSMYVEANSETSNLQDTTVPNESFVGSSDKNAIREVLQRSTSWHPSQRNMSAAFQKALLRTAFQVTQDSRIVTEVSNITDSSGEKVVLMLGRCLPHIVPNVLLAKREELIPLILATATLHPDSAERDNLLNILFNLIKRPNLDQRHIILTGCVAFAQHVGPERVESELLPQCWEQISHKYAERRLLVAEACGSLAPYLPNEIRSSLVLSMLQQMLTDDKTEEVREAVVRSLGLLMGFIDDTDKYGKGTELLTTALGDISERVLSATQQVFLPAFAMWASEIGRLQTELLQLFVDKMETLVMGAQRSNQEASRRSVAQQSTLDKHQFCLLVFALQELIPMLFSCVLATSPFADKLETAVDIQAITISTRFPKPSSELCDLSVIVGNSEKLAQLVHLYEEYISEEWYEPWDTFNWVSGEFIPQLLNLLNALEVTFSSVVNSLARFFYSLCRIFGRTFTATKIKPKFQVVLRVPDEQINTHVAAGRTPLTKCTVPVYAAGVLGAFGQEEDHKQLTAFLKELLCTLALCQASLDSIKAAFDELCLDSNYHELLLTVLWDGVVHTSANVRSAAAKMFELLIKGVGESLVSTRVVPALVTLASDPEINVRISTVAGFGTVIETVTDRSTLDKVHMQFQTFVDDPIYRDQHALKVELIRTFARVGPNAEPKFRDDFVLPRLAILSANNNHVNNEAHKADVAIQLFEAYSALSCCFISDQLIQETMLPGLRCLQRDLAQVAPDYVEVVMSMMRDFQDKVDAGKMVERTNMPIPASPQSGPRQAAPPGASGQDDVKGKMHSRFQNFKDKAQSRNFPKIFGKKGEK